jgi:hypothetical protein
VVGTEHEIGMVDVSRNIRNIVKVKLSTIHGLHMLSFHGRQLEHTVPIFVVTKYNMHQDPMEIHVRRCELYQTYQPI